MRIRRRSRSEKWLDRIVEVPWWQRGGALAVPAAAALGAVAYRGRRRVWQGIALLASGVEQVADTIEDGAEALRDAARARASPT
jgi:hypothetical protein